MGDAIGRVRRRGEADLRRFDHLGRRLIDEGGNLGGVIKLGGGLLFSGALARATRRWLGRESGDDTGSIDGGGRGGLIGGSWTGHRCEGELE